MFVLILYLLAKLAAQRSSMIVLSDTHIGGPWFGPGGKADATLVPFLKQFTLSTTTVHTLVLNGDLLDLWLFNFSTAPPKPHEMLLCSNFDGVNIKALTDVLNEILDNDVRIMYINGNHDDWMTEVEFEKAGLDRIEFYRQSVVVNNVNITHGHKYDFFNVPDPENNIRAFGYFMMRAATESGNVEMDTVSQLYDWTCNHVLRYAPIFINNATWLYERLIGGSLGETIWGEIANKEYKKVENRIVKGGCYYFHNKSGEEEDVVLSQAVKKYRCQIGRFLEVLELNIVEDLISGSCNYYDSFISRVDQDLFLMGHTHEVDLRILKRTTPMGGDVVYANSGAWLKLGEMLSYINVSMVEHENATKVSIFYIDPSTLEPNLWKSSPVPAPKSHSSSSSSMHSMKWKKTYEDNLKDEELMKLYHEQMMLEKKKKKYVPLCWTCDPDFYNSQDGCDCDCGCWDPDCGVLQTTCVQTCLNC